MLTQNPFPKVYPFASSTVSPDKLSRELFPDGRPQGITIHYTADRDEKRMRKALEELGLCYHLVISRDGKVSQHAWLDRQVWHAGKALWGGMSPNQRFLSIAIVSWGQLKRGTDKRYRAWNGAEVVHQETALRPSNTDPDQTYFWDAATPQQMASMNRICTWASSLGINPDNICGHDECAIPLGRKPDPGGVLPMSMVEYRKFLKVDLSKVS